LTDTKLLREFIKLSGLKYGYIASTLNLSSFGLQKKIDNISEFKAREIINLCKILNLTIDQKEKIFFANESDYTSTTTDAITDVPT